MIYLFEKIWELVWYALTYGALQYAEGTAIKSNFEAGSTQPASIHLFKVNNGNTSVWNHFNVKNKDTKTTSMMP